ncbi:hypothetical protein EMIT0111MI5_180012 [Burkholderia sp. IT-111MI5]
MVEVLRWVVFMEDALNGQVF